MSRVEPKGKGGTACECPPDLPPPHPPTHPRLSQVERIRELEVSAARLDEASKARRQLEVSPGCRPAERAPGWRGRLLVHLAATRCCRRPAWGMC